MSMFLQPLPILVLMLLGWSLRLRLFFPEARRAAGGIASIAVLLAVLSSDACAYLALSALESRYEELKTIPDDAQAIVVLSGAVRPANAWRSQPEPGPSTMYRCLHAAELHRLRPELPVVTTGGSVEGRDLTFSQVMRDFLISQRVPEASILLESKSRTTYENAFETSRVLQGRNIKKIVLVTDANHMPRSVACFIKQGFEVTPAPCNREAAECRWRLSELLPSGRGASRVEMAAHESIGILGYWLTGKI